MAARETDKTIRSVGEFISCLHETSTSKRRLFRGQNTDKPLLPRIMRLAKENHISPNDINGIEQRMLERFKKESVPMLQGTRKLADWELMSIAQHWGMPTRLLDWTANPLAGLWFAVSAIPLVRKTMVSFGCWRVLMRRPSITMRMSSHWRRRVSSNRPT